MSRAMCEIDGCPNLRGINRSRWCRTHQWRRRHYGDVRAEVPVDATRTPVTVTRCKPAPDVEDEL